MEMYFFNILNFFAIYNFSENSKDKEGNNFYTLIKHNPIIIDFSKNNDIYHLIFNMRKVMQI